MVCVMNDTTWIDDPEVNTYRDATLSRWAAPSVYMGTASLYSSMEWWPLAIVGLVLVGIGAALTVRHASATGTFIWPWSEPPRRGPRHDARPILAWIALGVMFVALVIAIISLMRSNPVWRVASAMTIGLAASANHIAQR